MKTTMILFGVCIALLTGCIPIWEEASEADHGSAFFFSDIELAETFDDDFSIVSYSADTPLIGRYLYYPIGCSGCVKNLSVDCNLEIDGRNIILRTNAKWERDRNCEICNDIKMYAVTTCSSSESLEEGKYTILFGENSASIEMPSTNVEVVRVDS